MSKYKLMVLASAVILLLGGVVVHLIEETRLVGLAFIFVAAIVGYFGYRRYQFHTYLAASTEDISTGRNDDPVNVEGTITSVMTDPVKAPITEEDAAVAVWKIEEWDEHGDGATWVQRGVGVMSTQFEVDTEHGHVVSVDLPDKTDTKEHSYLNKLPAGNAALQTKDGIALDTFVGALDSVDEEQLVVEPDEEPPASVSEFLASLENIDEGSGSITNAIDIGNKHGKRRYTVQTLGVDDSVYIHGQLENNGFNEPQVTQDDDGYTVVSSLSEDAFREKIENSVYVYAAIFVSCLLVSGYAGYLVYV